MIGRPHVAAVDVDEDGLAAALGATLPSYMVPAGFLPIAELPLLPSGKVDRKALRAAAVERREPPRAAVAGPADPVPAAVSRAWQKALGPTVPLETDHFFRLGGDSLGAVRMLVELRATLSVSVKLTEFLQRPVLATLH